MPDLSFPSNEPVTVWEIRVRHELLVEGGDTAGEEPPEVHSIRSQLVRRGALTSRLLLHSKRLVWELPEQGMPGGAAEPIHLVLRPKSGQVALMNHKQKRYRAGSPARIAAWIEGAQRALPNLYRLEVLGQENQREDSVGVPGQAGVTSDRPGGRSISGIRAGSQAISEPALGALEGGSLDGLAGRGGTGRSSPGGSPVAASARGSRRVTKVQAVLRQDEGGAAIGEQRIRMVAISRASPPDMAVQAALLWDALLLPFLPATSHGVLDVLRTEGHWPESLDITAASDSSLGAQSVGLRILLDLEGRHRRKIPAQWLRLPPVGYQQEFGPLLYRPARRLLHGDTRGLRRRVEGERRPDVVRAPERNGGKPPGESPTVRDGGESELSENVVWLRNQGRSTLFVYGDGLLLGWVGSRGEGRWDLLPPGYYRMAAHSMWGTDIWGPEDVYLPGPVTLR